MTLAPRGPRRSRLADVARVAGTSPPIASRVLNGDPTLTVSRELRERVLSAARSLNYRAHAGARGLRLAETGALGMLIPRLQNPSYMTIVRGAFQRAVEREFTVLLVEDSEEQEANETVVQLVQTGRIDGLIIGSARPDHPLLALLETAHVPHVFVNRAVPGSYRNVVVNEERATSIVIEYLIGLGHVRIGHLAGPAEIENAMRRQRQFVHELATRELDATRVVECAIDEHGGMQGSMALLQRFPDTTAIYASGGTQAVGALHGVWRLGLRVPADISVVSHSDMPLAAFLVPPLTAVQQPLEELGAAAVDALLDQIRDEAIGDRLIKTPPRMIERGSSASPKGLDPRERGA